MSTEQPTRSPDVSLSPPIRTGMFWFVIYVLKVLFSVLLAAATGLFSRPKGWAYGRHVTYTLVRAVTAARLASRLGNSPSDPNTKKKSTVEVYQGAAVKLGFEPRIETMPDGASACWIGRVPSPSTEEQPSTKSNLGAIQGKGKGKVLLYLHGGAYVNPVNPGHIIMLYELVKKANLSSRKTGESEGDVLSVLLLAYDLSPQSSYPTQLKQAVSALRYLLTTVGLQPSKILVAGDSAGGNLALALMSHLSHPHPEIDAITLGPATHVPAVPQSQPLRWPLPRRGKSDSDNDDTNALAGLFLLSPWVSFRYNSLSMRTNADKDFVQVSSLEEGICAYLKDRPIDNYNEPLTASPEDWWCNLKAKDICILAGEYEIFLHDIRAMAEKIKSRNPQTEYVWTAAELHVHAAVDRALGYGAAESEQVFANWIMARL